MKNLIEPEWACENDMDLDYLPDNFISKHFFTTNQELYMINSNHVSEEFESDLNYIKKLKIGIETKTNFYGNVETSVSTSYEGKFNGWVTSKDNTKPFVLYFVTKEELQRISGGKEIKIWSEFSDPHYKNKPKPTEVIHKIPIPTWTKGVEIGVTLYNGEVMSDDIDFETYIIDEFNRNVKSAFDPMSPIISFESGFELAYLK